MDAIRKGMELCGFSEPEQLELLGVREQLPPQAQALMEAARQDYAGNREFPYTEYWQELERQLKPPLLYGAWYLLAMTLTPQMCAYYAESGLPQSCVEGALRDIRHKLYECRTRYGCAGWFSPKWFRNWFLAARTAFRRLQFELRECPVDYPAGGIRSGDRVVFVHIPGGQGPLDYEACLADFRDAAALYAPQYPGGTVPFFCHSWLLNPYHPQFLPSKSRILPFQQLFDISEFREEPDGRFLWRLYGTDQPDPAAMPERNSLERAYTAWMLQGGAIGEGFGFLLWKDQI